MKVKGHLKVISILGKKELEFELEADNFEDIKNLVKVIDGMSLR